MFVLLPITLAIILGGLVLTFTSETFADAVSRIVESAFDAIEYKLALRAQRYERRAPGKRFTPDGIVFRGVST
jgi:hypothetical protein